MTDGIPTCVDATSEEDTDRMGLIDASSVSGLFVSINFGDRLFVQQIYYMLSQAS